MTAVLSVMVLVGAIGWRVDQLFQNKNDALSVVAGAAASDHSAIPDNNQPADYGAGATGDTSASGAASDPLNPSVISDSVADALASEYATMEADGTYSTSSAAAQAQQLGASIKADVTYKTYSPSAIKTSSDTSYTGMLAYRAALQTSLEPLMKSTTPELDMLTNYVETNDPTYLTQLEQAADTYKLAAQESASIVVPADAVSVQIGILDAMQEFGATLDQMSASAKDPFAEAALLNTYMQAQSDMFSSFNDLYSYYKSKQQ
jgi:hypothetical protein